MNNMQQMMVIIRDIIIPVIFIYCTRDNLCLGTELKFVTKGP